MIKKILCAKLLIIIFGLFFMKRDIKKIKKLEDIKNYASKKSMQNKENHHDNNMKGFNRNNSNLKKCYISSDNYDIKIKHLIITRFMIEKLGVHVDIPPKKNYEKNYIFNGVRVMKKYLFPSLDYQSCKKFILIIMLGDKANKTYIESLIEFNYSFEIIIIYQRDIKAYIKKVSKHFDILITTRIDYDDRIYFDAVNDVRKAINIHKPMILYGYNRGLHYYESENK